MRPSNNLEDSIPWYILKNLANIIHMNVQAHSSLEPPLEHNQDETSLMSQG